MPGFLSGLFGGGKKRPYKKYEDLVNQALKIGQSTEYAFKQAIDVAVKDGVFQSQREACEKLFEAISASIDPEYLPELKSAREKFLRIFS